MAKLFFGVSRILKSFVFIGITIGFSSSAFATNYYFDSNSPAGGSGTKASPWNNLDKACSYNQGSIRSDAKVFAPGDTLYLKAGSVFTGGQIWPAAGSSGTPTNPVVVDSYSTGSKPKIACGLNYTSTGTGQLDGKSNGAAILLNSGVGGWEINNLEITNPQGMGGIKIFASSGQQVSYFRFRNLEIHDIAGIPAASTGKPFFGGIYLKIGDANSKINDLVIENCQVYNIQHIGIQTGIDAGGALDIANRFSGIIIRNTSVYACGSLGIILRNCNNALIENCTIYKTGLTAYANKSGESFGVRLKYNNGSKIQNCEAYENLSGDAGGEGGQGFTFDAAAVACTLQYCYSHNNWGGFISVISDPGEISSNNVIRYNISQNDSNQTFWFGLPSLNSNNTSIYNNTIYVASTVPLAKVVAYESGSNTSFKNNIFYINKNATYDNGPGTPPTYDHNCFFGSNTNTPSDAAKITSDPLINFPGSAGVGMATTGVYKLKPGSPCINAGVTITPNGGKDFWASEVPLSGTATDIGAYEGAGTATTGIARPSPAQKYTIGNAEIGISKKGQLTARLLNGESFVMKLYSLNGSCLASVASEGNKFVHLNTMRLPAESYVVTIRSQSKSVSQVVMVH